MCVVYWISRTLLIVFNIYDNKQIALATLSIEIFVLYVVQAVRRIDRSIHQSINYFFLLQSINRLIEVVDLLNTMLT